MHFFIFAFKTLDSVDHGVGIVFLGLGKSMSFRGLAEGMGTAILVV